ncbi:MAG: aldehyde ferredoxin oxidoreductase family protein [Desulfobacterales bacterium]|nr:MAG: aldehyde ferredoxin oxidoreductase family protein [Desulfobacterales bacterium]
MYGFMGRILEVNLNQGTFEIVTYDAGLAQEYLGGAGLAAYFLSKDLEVISDPLDQGNKILFFVGPLTGTQFPTAVRYEVCTRSPLTGAWLDSSSSGVWGRYLKLAGYDGIIVKGISMTPVFLMIDEDGASLHDAGDIWGQETFETQMILKKKMGSKNTSIACIGPAGEKLIPMACIINDEGRAAGRGGAGAVMGSKRLKAIIVRGSQGVSLADAPHFREIVKDTYKLLKQSLPMQQRRKFGTAGSRDTNWAVGSIPVKNWTIGQWQEGCIRIGGKRIADSILRPHAACFGCPVQCSRWIKIDEGKFQMEGPGPEYETLCAFGTLCLNDDLESICWANDLCNRYGIDTISAGSAIAFAMEAYERGLITAKDTGGIEPLWGKKDVIVQLTELICRKEGFGEILGEGTKRASEKIGGQSREFATHVKGMEVAMHDPRAFFSMAGSYATSPRGGCHLHGLSMLYEAGLTLPEAGVTQTIDRHSNEGKGQFVMAAQDFASTVNSTVICFLSAFGMLPETLKILSSALNAACGFTFTARDLLLIGERITNLQRLINLRFGFSREHDTLPKRLLEPVADGPNAGKTPDLEFILRDYYRVRGWNDAGVPTKQKLSELGLSF